MSSPARVRLLPRREALTCDIEIPSGLGGAAPGAAVRLLATVGFDEEGVPREVFLCGAKDGSGLAAILDDASVVISIALQHGVTAAALAKSVARLPERLDGPAVKAASAIGAVLDLVRGLAPAVEAPAVGAEPRLVLMPQAAKK